MLKKIGCLFLVLCILSCGKKKLDLSGATTLKPKDFLSVFTDIPGNFSTADSNFIKISDSNKIALKAFSQFIPDSILVKYTNQSKQVYFSPIGKIVKEKETYLLVNMFLKHRSELIVFVINTKNNTYLASKELLNNSFEDDYLHTLSINKEPTFIIGQEKNGKDNLIQFSRTGWVYADGVGFMVVVNDSNESLSQTSIINPIDTLPRKNKLSADYGSDKRNFISIRDGKNSSSYSFFLHFEKNESACIGELKGDFKMKDSNHATYQYTGEPCVVDFTFEDNQVSFKETGSCGNHRGIKCFFDDQFTRLKDSKNKKKK